MPSLTVTGVSLEKVDTILKSWLALSGLLFFGPYCLPDIIFFGYQSIYLNGTMFQNLWQSWTMTFQNNSYQSHTHSSFLSMSVGNMWNKFFSIQAVLDCMHISCPIFAWFLATSERILCPAWVQQWSSLGQQKTFLLFQEMKLWLWSPNGWTQ